MTLLWYPVAAVAGAVAGTIVHEMSHAVVAVAVGELVDVGWQGGLAGGPFVDFRAPTRLRSEAVRKAPLILGAIGAVLLVATYQGPTLSWVALAGGVAGVLWTSPEDLCLNAAKKSPANSD